MPVVLLTCIYHCNYSFVPKSQAKMMRTPRPFPVLPIDDDLESDGEADENDHMLANRSPDRGRSHDRKGSSRRSTMMSPLFALGPVLASLLGPKSATPTIEECQIRLAQIGSEIQKAQIMFEDTTNGEVRSACRRRMSKLASERRIHQIVQEGYKIQTMSKTTRVRSVRMACEERLRQLMSELKSLEVVSGGEDAGARDATGGRSDHRDSPGGAVNDEEDAVYEDGGCHGRVLEYLGGAEATHDETPSKSPDGSAHCHLDGGRRFERPPHDDDRGRASSRRRGRADTVITMRDRNEAPGMSGTGTIRGSFSAEERCEAFAKVFARSSTGTTTSCNRHPVAYAVKSSTSWIG